MDHFVGRAGELAILDAELQAVRAGRPRVVLVEGEAGIGKSSLLSRFVSEHRDVCLLRASGDEAEILLAWGLADQLLAGAGEAGAGGWPGGDPGWAPGHGKTPTLWPSVRSWWGSSAICRPATRLSWWWLMTCTGVTGCRPRRFFLPCGGCRLTGCLGWCRPVLAS